LISSFIFSQFSFPCVCFIFLLPFHFLVQHELGQAADDGVRQLVEQSEGEVSPADKAAAMKTAIEKRAVALRIKMGQLVAVSIPELSDGWLREVGTLTLSPYHSVSLMFNMISHPICHTD
jgi:hypothetical protein